MCGIVGFSGHELDERTLLRAVQSLRHRGPDGTGSYMAKDGRVGLGHARLSVIDLSTGGQPLFSEQRDIVLVCNGEIYDFERIRSRLEDRGHHFATRSDSEVIIHLYQEHGLDFLDHLRGEFAFLLYDRPKQLLLAVRDRFGIKPLFIHQQGGNYVFASEAKALFATGLVTPSIDVAAIRDYVSGLIPDSIFEQVDVVPPGCLLKVDLSRGTHEIERYWDLDLPVEEDVEDRGLLEHASSVRGTFAEAVRHRMRADVPVGVYLSGGIDSAIVAATAARSCPGRLKAFTITFPDAEEFDELRLARDMAARIDADLYSVSCDEDALLGNTVDCLWVSEMPFPNFHGVGKFMLSRLARAHVKVVLTGEGSDETFLGYDYFQPGSNGTPDPTGRHARRTRPITEALGFVPTPVHVSTLSPRQQGHIRSLFRKSLRPGLRSRHPLDRLKARMDPAQTEGRSNTRKIQYFSFKRMLAPYLLTMLGDRAEMGHSLEGRTPFLDHHLFERARTIPERHKIRDGVEKYVLREAFKDELTSELYARKKWPYLAPPVWIAKGRSPESDRLIERALSRDAIERAGIFDQGTIRRIRFLQRIIPFDCRLKRVLNGVLTLCLTVQILDELFVQDFDRSLQSRLFEPRAS